MDKVETLAAINKAMKNTLMETLSIKYIDYAEDFSYMVATMPVTPRVHQPMGLLHGGATIALAESVGSAASHFAAGDKFEARGLEISANHVRSIREGMVTATARIIHRGRSTHLWEIRIVDEQDRLISICKLTNMIIPKRKIN